MTRTKRQLTDAEVWAHPRAEELFEALNKTREAVG
jgi:hypothetical protein